MQLVHGLGVKVGRRVAVGVMVEVKDGVIIQLYQGVGLGVMVGVKV